MSIKELWYFTPFQLHLDLPAIEASIAKETNT